MTTGEGGGAQTRSDRRTGIADPVLTLHDSRSTVESHGDLLQEGRVDNGVGVDHHDGVGLVRGTAVAEQLSERPLQGRTLASDRSVSGVDLDAGGTGDVHGVVGAVVGDDVDTHVIGRVVDPGECVERGPDDLLRTGSMRCETGPVAGD
jgi:hypothetical protein